MNIVRKPQNTQARPGPLRLWHAGGLLACCGLLAGCHSLTSLTWLKPRQEVPGAGATRDNVYLSAPVLPPDVKRVAVLPLTTDERYADLLAGRETLDPVLNAELTKTERFEVIRVTGEGLRNCTGSTGWRGEEALPPGIFSSLRETYGCDAVLFCQLTEFRAYAPLAVGWRLKLVDARTRQILWAGDEIFDAGQSAVKVGASRYQSKHQRSGKALPDDWVMQNSPRRFGQYTVAKLLATLPAR